MGLVAGIVEGEKENRVAYFCSKWDRALLGLSKDYFELGKIGTSQK